MPSTSFCLLALLLAWTSGCDQQAASEKPHAPPALVTAPAPPSVAQAPAPAAEVATETDIVPRDVPRVYAKSRNVWIRSGPTSDTQWLGFLWFGGSVQIRELRGQAGLGCSKKWIAIEPRGWVCVDGEQATTDPDDRELAQLYRYRPRVDTPWPHHYAAVHEMTRRYAALPDRALQKAWELSFERHLADVFSARKTPNAPLEFVLSGRAAPVLPKLPRGLSEKRDRIWPRSAFAYSEAFDHDERAFLLAADLTWVPRDRVELLARTEFQGLALGGDTKLPLAFFRGRERPTFRKDASGEFVPAEARFERLGHVPLSGEIEQRERVRYFKLRDQDLWVSSREAVVPEPQRRTPWGAPVGQADTTGVAPPGRATWLEISILGGWLMAFEGTRPAYVTMISAGRGGTPQGDKDPLATASTPTGRFPISGKFKTATMESSSSPIVHGDVPWTQNFSGPHAIHSAYWHDDWGSLKSAGCVNVAPRDGKWLFEFTEPEVPEGWHGVRQVGRYGPSTWVIVHE